MNKRFSTPLLLSALLLGSATAQSTTAATDAAGSSMTSDSTLQTTATQPAGTANLPESAQAVRRILESRGLLSSSAPVRLPAPRGLTISDSLRALLPNAVWDQAAPAQANMGEAGTGMMTGTMTGTMTQPATSDMGTDMDTSMDQSGSGTTEPATATTGTNVVNPTVTGDAMTQPAASGMNQSGSTGTPSGADQTQAQTTQAQSGQDILDALAADGRFTTFLSLLKFAGLEEALLDDEYTLLVPTDDAFAALDPTVVAAAKADPELAGYVLGYHVVPGRQTPGQGTLTNVYGEALPADLQVSGDAITAGGSQAYALNSVIMPADLTGQ
ncbi:MAG: fasciclin domain-containing protein [Deinococcus sp.]|nr:fasciclin domain-containing protein [Deinococcus sp.]